MKSFSSITKAATTTDRQSRAYCSFLTMKKHPPASTIAGRRRMNGTRFLYRIPANYCNVIVVSQLMLGALIPCALDYTPKVIRNLTIESRLSDQ